MALSLDHAKLVATQGTTGEVWIDDNGCIAFIPSDPELGKELAKRSADVAVLLFEMLNNNFTGD